MKYYDYSWKERVCVRTVYTIYRVLHKKRKFPIYYMMEKINIKWNKLYILLYEWSKKIT